MRQGFYTISVKPEVSVPSTLTGGSPAPSDGNWIDHATGWVGDRLSDGASMIIQPIGSALRELLISGVHVLPIVLVAAGLFCFIMTIIMANKKPYFWGIGCWAASAIVRAMTSDLNI